MTKPIGSADDARRRAEAIEMTREAEAEELRDEMERAPLPVPGLLALAQMLRDSDRSAIPQARALRASEDWTRLEPTERAICAEWLRLGVKAAWKTVVVAHLGHVDRSGRWHDAPVDDDGAPVSADPPWSVLCDDDGAIPEAAAWAPVGRGLLAFDGAVVSVTAASKQGKSTAVWADLAPVTAAGGKVLAIVGPSERGPGNWKDYGRLVAAAGGRASNVLRMDPPASLAAVTAHMDGAGILVVVIDSAASLMAGLGRKENSVEDVRATLDEFRQWGVPVVLVRHNVNAGNDPRARDADASRGAGSRDWRAAVDAEAELRRQDDTATLTWAGRDGCPDVTGFRLDKSTWPYTVEVLGPDDMPTGGPTGDAPLDDDRAEAAVLAALAGVPESAPINLTVAKDRIGSTVSARDSSGRWWKPYRAAVNRLYVDGRLCASRDPADAKRGSPCKLWLPEPKKETESQVSHDLVIHSAEPAGKVSHGSSRGRSPLVPLLTSGAAATKGDTTIPEDLPEPDASSPLFDLEVILAGDLNDDVPADAVQRMRRAWRDASDEGRERARGIVARIEETVPRILAGQPVRTVEDAVRFAAQPTVETLEDALIDSRWAATMRRTA